MKVSDGQITEQDRTGPSCNYAPEKTSNQRVIIKQKQGLLPMATGRRPVKPQK